jgi:RNA polymerase sigma-70 factor, ECF subfamily
VSSDLQQDRTGQDAAETRLGRPGVGLVRNCVADVAATVAAAQAGNAEAFSALVEEYGPRLLSYLHQWIGNRHDAEDMVQETFLKACRNLYQCRNPGAFPGWLFTIARHTALNHLRSRRPTEPLDPERLVDGEDPATMTSARDERRVLWEFARRHLRVDQFEVLWLRYAEALSMKEISQVTGRNGIHVRVLLHRARAALLQALDTCPGPWAEQASDRSTILPATRAAGDGLQAPSKCAPLSMSPTL